MVKPKEIKMLEKGDVFEIEKGHSIYVNAIPSLFLCDNGDFNWEMSNGEIKDVGKMQRGLDTSIFCGDYVVVETNLSGGGTGHGPGDVYPDGHKVTAKKVVKNFLNGNKKISDFEIHFYQSGCFSCMNPGIKAKGKAELRFHIVGGD